LTFIFTPHHYRHTACTRSNGRHLRTTARRVLYGQGLEGTDTTELDIVSYNKCVAFGVCYVICRCMRCVWALTLAMNVSSHVPFSTPAVNCARALCCSFLASVDVALITRSS